MLPGKPSAKAYGRLEEAHVQPLTLKKLRHATKEAFDLPDTEMLLKGGLPASFVSEAISGECIQRTVVLTGPDGPCAESEEMLKKLASVMLAC